MIARSILPRTTALLLCAGLAAASMTLARADEIGDITAVTGRVAEDYVRTKGTDGAFAPEYYTFGPGGLWAGSSHDDTIDKMKFLDVARVMAVPLAGKNYLPAKDPKNTKLLIMVYWGTTKGTTDTVASENLHGTQIDITAQQQAGQKGTSGTAPTGGQISDSDLALAVMGNRLRDIADNRNARMLGYDAEDLIGSDYGRILRGTARHMLVEDLYTEIEDSRYFVVLMAYDFQLMWKEKKNKLLWETRFSIRERGNDFGKILPEIARYASRYFGQDSHGLVRKPLGGRVDYGEIKVIGEVPEKK